MGSSDNSKTYLIGVKDEKGTFKVRKSRNVTFNEQKMFNNNSLSAGQTSLVQEADLNPVAFLNELINDNAIPKSTEEAIKYKNLYETMKTEFNSLVENNVWELVDNQEIKPIVSRSHFALKCGPSGEIVRYKARLVAKGFSQVPGRDYNETYSPTTRLSTIRMPLIYALRNGSELKQMDIKTAYLNADLDEEIFMQQPEGFEKYNDQGNPIVCKLNKSLYGLKQSGRNW